MHEAQHINKAFPYKDSNGNPAFREHQKEVIHSAVEAFSNGKKFFPVEGPVGCGKSVINLTIARSIPGRAVYLTPTRQLQDQIGEEGWDDVAVLKGSGGYACTYCQDITSTKYRVSYEGEEVRMCNNHSVRDFNGNINILERSIRKHHEVLKDNSGALALKTSFTPGKVTEQLDKIGEMFWGEFHEQMAIDIEDRKPEYRRFSGETPQDVIGAFIDSKVYKSVGCHLDNFECPKKSAIALAKLSKVAVLNPDIMYYMNSFMYNSPFSNVDLLIVDESHSFEGVISRIFSSSIPVNVLQKVYGINMYDIMNAKPHESVKLYEETKERGLRAILNTVKVISKFFQTMLMTDTMSASVFVKSKSSYVASFKAQHLRNINDSNTPIDEIVKVIRSLEGAEDPPAPGTFRDEVSTFVNKMHMNNTYKHGVEFSDLKSVIPFIRRFIGRDMGKLQRNRLTRMSLTGRQVNASVVKESVIIADFLVELKSMLSSFVGRIGSLKPMSDDEAQMFMFTPGKVKPTDILSKGMMETGLFGFGVVETINAVVINPGAVIRKFFYSCADHVLLTSGTWVYPKSAYRALGLSQEDKLYKIPSTFPAARRPIFLLRDKKLVNFSERSSDGSGDYVYEKGDSVKSWTTSLIKLLTSTKKGLSKNGCNPNIIVHTNSFKLSKLIAENAPIDRSNVIIHSPDNVMYNGADGMVIPPHSKEAFLTIAKGNPDSGKVFISPSVTEGVDFKGDIARAQVILKHPMPSWVDPYIKALMGRVRIDGLRKDPDIYKRMIYTTLIQQYGRVMRDSEDWGATFIFDQKCVDDIGEMLTNPYEARKANIGYFLEGVKIKRQGRSIVALRPTFKLDL